MTLIPSDSVAATKQIFERLSEKYPRFLDFAEAVSAIDKPLPNADFAFGYAQSMIRSLVGMLHQIRAAIKETDGDT